MHAFKFGWNIYKIAAAPPESAVPPNAPALRDPDYQAIRQRLAKANLPAAAWQHAGLPAMTAEQLQGASARDVWHINQQLAKSPRATYRRGTDPRQVNAYNSARQYATNLGKQHNPVFAAEGKPGYKPPLASIQGGPAQPANPAAAGPPRVPAQPPPAPAGPAAPPRPAMPAWKHGDPVPAGFVENDLKQLMPKDPNLTKLQTQPMAPPVRLPPAVPRAAPPRR